MPTQDGQKLQLFIAKGAATKLNPAILAKWEEKISIMPHKQAFTILYGPSLEKSEKFAKIRDSLHLSISEEDAVVICCGTDVMRICKILGYLRNYMGEECGLRSAPHFSFLWVQKFPLFTRNENDLLESTHHPFTAPINEHLMLLKNGEKLEAIEAQHYDLVLNGVEIGGGSIRIHDSDLQRHVLENILKLDCAQLSHLLDALKYGAPPHGGFALGLDRFVAILNENGDPGASIRNVIAFPKASDGCCQMTGSPAMPSKELLER